jgi:hypothetical protein
MKRRKEIQEIVTKDHELGAKSLSEKLQPIAACGRRITG